MTKSFFIVVPYAPAVLGKGSKNPVSGITSMFGPKKTKAENAADATSTFEENRSQLQQRMDVVEQGLVRCGIRVVELGTEELIELFYKIFNPGDIDKPIHVA